MMKIRKYIFPTLMIFILTLTVSPNVGNNNSVDQSTYSTKHVIMLSVDALRFDFLDDTSFANLPGFEWSISHGIRGTGMLVPNPTLTATGHVSISSAANSSVHGIMGNTYYDWNDNYLYSLFDDPQNPLINTNTGSNLLQNPQGYHWVVMNGGKSGTVGWPYSENAYDGTVEPTLRNPFSEVSGLVDKGISLKILDMLDTDSEIELIYARFRGVDSSLHSSEEYSSSFITSFENTDEALLFLYEGLKERNMLEDTTIMIFGDHGMNPVTDSSFFIEDTTEYANAVSTTGLTPIFAHDSGFSYMYFPDAQNEQQLFDFANIIKTNPSVDSVFVNREHESLGMYNPSRGINVSVWFKDDVSRNFGSPFANMHGYLNDNEKMKADFIMLGAGVDLTADLQGINALDLTPTSLELLGYNNIPRAQGTARTDLITNTLGPDGSDLPQEEVPSSSTPSSSEKENSDNGDSPFPFISAVFTLIAIRIILQTKRRYNW